MSVLDAIRDAGSIIGAEIPEAVFGSEDETAMEFAAIAREAADYIAGLAEWQAITTLHQITGDGLTTEFALPSDYRRMKKEGKLRSSAFDGPLCQIRSHDEWLRVILQNITTVLPVWTLLGGALHFHPAPAAGEVISGYYIRNTIVTDSGGTVKARFTADDDAFFLGDRILKLAIIWRWRSNRRVPYAEDLANFEAEVAQLVTDDKGPGTIMIGQASVPRGVEMAWPGTIVP